MNPDLCYDERIKETTDPPYASCAPEKLEKDNGLAEEGMRPPYASCAPERLEKNIALLEEGGAQLTYAGLAAEGRALAKAVGRRSLVFLLCRNCIGAALGYAAFLSHRIVPVMLHADMEQGALGGLLERYRPQYVWLPAGQRGNFPWEAVYESYGYTLLRTDYGKGYPLYEELALLLTTSGSTGSPKFVRQSYKNIRANTKSIIQYLHLDHTQRPITTLPMNYTYGLSILTTHLAVGATVLLTEKGLMQKAFWDFFKKYGATSFGGVPYTYEMLSKLRFFQMELPSLRTMTQAGGKLTPQLHETFAAYAARHGKEFVVMYGQCEATARMGYLPPGKAAQKKGAMGIAIPGGRFTLVDAGGKPIATPGTVGELVYEGENVTLGYAECGDDLGKADEWNGKLSTGDMAQFDEDGYYYIVGRKKRFLKIYGNRVNLDEMERLIRGKYVVETACAGVDDHMYIFLADGTRSHEIREYAVCKTGLNQAAFQVKVIGEIPKNDAGKIQYTQLAKYYEGYKTDAY